MFYPFKAPFDSVYPHCQICFHVVLLAHWETPHRLFAAGGCVKPSNLIQFGFNYNAGILSWKHLLTEQLVQCLYGVAANHSHMPKKIFIHILMFVCYVVTSLLLHISLDLQGLTLKWLCWRYCLFTVTSTSVGAVCLIPTVGKKRTTTRYSRTSDIL